MEKPILFKTEMVKAILAGRKTQTRRVVKYPSNDYEIINIKHRCPGSKIFYIDGFNKECNSKHFAEITARYQVGDILWVRETWAKIEDFKNYNDVEIEEDLKYLFKCDDYGIEHAFVDIGVQRWRPSIHMPKEAARIFLKVTGIRVERLQEISEDDARKESASCIGGILNFKFIWENTLSRYNYYKYGWTANPWVWVYEFERVI